MSSGRTSRQSAMMQIHVQLGNAELLKGISDAHFVLKSAIAVPDVIGGFTLRT